MRTIQAQLKSTGAAEEVKKVVEIDPQLVMMFGSYDAFAQGGLAAKVSKQFPKALTIGCSTAGEISNSGVHDNSLVVTGTRFNTCDFRPVSATVHSMEDTHSAGVELAKKFERKGLKFAFVLGRGLEINGSALISGMREVLGPDVIITGGLAGDGGRFKQTFTILNGEIADNCVVGFGVYGDSVGVAYGSMGGWEPFGPPRKVTKSKANVLFELDGEPALAIYKKYLGDKAKDLPGSGLLFPFALLKDNRATSGIIRTILAVDEKQQSVTFAGDIPENGWMRLMHANNAGLVKGAKSAAESTNQLVHDKNGEALGILISCVGRKLVMGDEIEDELDAVKEVFGNGSVTGFYSYGEICAQDGFAECKLHNQTMTITYLYETKKAA